MSDTATVETVEDAIADVTHPEIDATLVELGMIDDVRADDGTAEIDVAIPMLGIPAAIKQLLAQRLTAAVEPTGIDLDVDFVVMDEQTKQRFFELEQQNWSGLDDEDDDAPDAPF
jgi:metal-sulfur cluster biosynthetic enzyme